jgi:hypothetical protein
VTRPGDALRREAGRLEAEGKVRKWGLLDPNHELTDDGTAGRFVALEPDQLRFAAILADRLVGGDGQNEAISPSPRQEKPAACPPSSRPTT